MARKKAKKKVEVYSAPSAFIVEDEPQLYKITLTLGRAVYESTGPTLLDALTRLEHPRKIVGKGFLTISNGEKRVEQMMMPTRLKRMFWNRNFQAVHAGMLERIMK